MCPVFCRARQICASSRTLRLDAGNVGRRERKDLYVGCTHGENGGRVQPGGSNSYFAYSGKEKIALCFGDIVGAWAVMRAGEEENQWCA